MASNCERISFNNHTLKGKPMNISERELEVLCLISHGHNNKEIADFLEISNNTVQTHRRRLLLKLNAKNSAGLVRVGFEQSLLPVTNRKVVDKINGNLKRMQNLHPLQ